MKEFNFKNFEMLKINKSQEAHFNYSRIRELEVSNSELKLHFINSGIEIGKIKDSKITNSVIKNARTEYLRIKKSKIDNVKANDSSFKSNLFSEVTIQDSVLINCSFKNCLFDIVNFKNTNLKYSDFSNATLHHVKFENVDFRYCIGNGKEIKSSQLGGYRISYGFGVMNIGCQSHKYEDWLNFTDDEILEMGENEGLSWWKENKRVVFELIEREAV